MPQVSIPGLNLEYEAFGTPGSPAMLLVMGLGGQLIHWPEAFCNELSSRGFYVIRYDNRDVGLSSKFDDLGVPDLMALYGMPKEARQNAIPYTMFDMVSDAIGLLDALDIEQAHIVGASMGGTISQLLTATHPDRCLSLTLIMSTTGHPDLTPADPEMLGALVAPVDPAGGEEALIHRGIMVGKLLMSPGYPTDDAVLRNKVEQALRRGGDAATGRVRQLAAAISAPDTRGYLAEVKCPVEVLHGADDKLIPMDASEDIARCAPGARLQIVEGMAHDFPEALMMLFADTIQAAASRSQETQ